jgi:hypothetical protein
MVATDAPYARPRYPFEAKAQARQGKSASPVVVGNGLVRGRAENGAKGVRRSTVAVVGVAGWTGFPAAPI